VVRAARVHAGVGRARARRGQVLQCNRHALGVAAPALRLFIWLTRSHTNRAPPAPEAQKTVRRAAANGQTADRLTVRGRRAEIKRCCAARPDPGPIALLVRDESLAVGSAASIRRQVDAKLCRSRVEPGEDHFLDLRTVQGGCARSGRRAFKGRVDRSYSRSSSDVVRAARVHAGVRSCNATGTLSASPRQRSGYSSG
jgi:hypothetical protein